MIRVHPLADTRRLAAAENCRRLAALFHHRWALQVLRDLIGSATSSARGSSASALANRLGTSRSLLRATLAALARQGLVEQDGNRFRLTEDGEPVARLGGRLLFILSRLRVGPAAQLKWSFPVIAVLDYTEGRFNRLRDALPGITPRALAATLKALEADRLVRRSVVHTYPPRSRYDLTPRALQLLPLLQRL
jgi:DNA-binding HxlR family transcriptional regulator